MRKIYFVIKKIGDINPNGDSLPLHILEHCLGKKNKEATFTSIFSYCVLNELLNYFNVDINDLMIKLGQKGIDSLLLEGGATLNAAFLEAGCVDEVYAFIAPKIIGGEHSKSPVGGQGIELMKDAIMLKDIKIETFDNDILIKCRVES